jgi:drug/metabolite transporter (DMT)-like permease
MNASAKLLAPDYPLIQIIWARFAGHLALAMLLFLPTRGWRLFATTRPRLQVARSTAQFFSHVAFVTGLVHVPLATASAIGFSAPFVVTALSVLLLGEKVGWRRWTAVIVGFVGVMFIIRPGAPGELWAMLVILLSALFYASYQVLTRKVAPHDDAITSILWMPLVGALLLTAVVPLYFVVPRSLLDLLLFLSIGSIGGISHSLLVWALRQAEVSILAPLAYMELLTVVALGYALFGNFPDPLTWVGLGIIVACGLYIGYRETVRARQAALERRRP